MGRKLKYQKWFQENVINVLLMEVELLQSNQRRIKMDERKFNWFIIFLILGMGIGNIVSYIDPADNILDLFFISLVLINFSVLLIIANLTSTSHSNKQKEVNK